MSTFKSGIAGFAVGVALAGAGAQAAVQAAQHQHQVPSAQMPPADAMKGREGMKDMQTMMTDPAMHQKMMANMAQCRDMMSMMMEHMKHEGMPADATAVPHKH